ncbi:MAG: hypothetical protein ACKVT2_20265 [Saprospiraceae bacterium]
MTNQNEEIQSIADTLTSGRISVREEILHRLETNSPPIDKGKLRSFLKTLLINDYPSPSLQNWEGVEKDVTSDARSWILSALGRLSKDDKETFSFVKDHLDQSKEPNGWVRYWALAGLVAGKVEDLPKLAQSLISTQDKLVSSLAHAILAQKGEVENLKVVEKNLMMGPDDFEYSDGPWPMLRALRIVPIDKTSVIENIFTILEKNKTHIRYDAIVVLASLPPKKQYSRQVVQSLMNFLFKNRHSLYDAERAKALIGLGNFSMDERSAPILIDELSDDSPTIVFEAARSLEKVLGAHTATLRLLEAASKTKGDSLFKFANAFRSMNREAVVKELENVMLSGPEEFKEKAREFLSEVGGSQAFQILRTRYDAANKYIDVLEAAEAKVRTLFEESLVEARRGFKIATWMDLAVFIVGLLLIIISASQVFWKGESLDKWAGVGIAGGIGLLGVLYGILISNPRRQIRESVDHLMNLKIVFLAYLRQLHQADQAYTRRLLDSKEFMAEEVSSFSKMVETSMSNAVTQLSKLKHNDTPGTPKPDSNKSTETPKEGSEQIES